MDYPETKKICVPCGVDITNGKKLSTETTALSSGEKSGEGTRGERRPVKTDWSLRMFVKMFFPGIFKRSVLITSLILAGIAALLTYFGVTLLLLVPGAGRAASIVCGIALLLYCQAFAWLQVGDAGVLLPKALADYNLIQWFFLVVSTLLFVFVLCYIVVLTRTR